MNIDVARSDRWKAFLSALVLAGIVLWIAQPAVEAAVRAVRVRGTVKTAVTNIGSKKINPQGVFQAPGSKRALDVRTFGAGNGFLAAADCIPATPIPATVEAPGGSVVTGLLLTGTDETVTVTAEALGNHAVPLLHLRTTAENPNAAFSLGNGLKATAPVRFALDCGADPLGNLVLIGQSN